MDINGTTEFMSACARGDHVLVAHLLKNEDVFLYHENEFGDTAFTLAVKYGQMKIIKMLLKLDVGVLFTNKDAFEKLLNCDDIDMNIRDDDGWTPLETASYHYCYTDYVKELLEIDGLNIKDAYEYVLRDVYRYMYRKCKENEDVHQIVKLIQPRMHFEYDQALRAYYTLLMDAYDYELKNCADNIYVGLHRNVKLFRRRKQQETFLTSEYIQAIRLPSICKELSNEIASYLSWEDVSPQRRAPANVLAENQHLMTKYTKQFS